MEFVDYKCLESLLIEGEELIATEGFIDTVKKKIADFFRLIGRLITKFISIIKAKFSKGKSSSKFSSEELKKMGIDTFEPAKKNPPSDEDAKKAADSIKQRYENSTQYKKHKADSGEAKKQVEEARATKPQIQPGKRKKKNCAAKIYDMILKLHDVEKSMFNLTLDLYKLDMQSYATYNMSPLHNRFDAIGDKINAIEEIYDSINDNIDNYYLGIKGMDTQDNIIRGLEQTKADIDKHIAVFEKNDKAAKSVYRDKPNSPEYNKYTPMMKNCSKVTTLISNFINLVNKLDTDPFEEIELYN